MTDPSSDLAQGGLPAAPTSAAEARALVEAVRVAAAARGVEVAAPPEAPEPAMCCERGCEYCVWRVYYAALEAWREDAVAALSAAFAPGRG